MKKYLILVFVAVLGLSSCGIDGGLLDPNSDLSKKEKSDMAEKSSQKAEALFFDDTAVDWYGNFCSATNYFSKSLDNGSNNSSSTDAAEVKNRYVQLFLTNADTSYETYNRIKNFPLPNTDTNKWKNSAQSLAVIYKNLGDYATEYANRIQAVDYTNVDLLQSTIQSSVTDWSNQIKKVSNKITSVNIPFGNERMAAAAQNLPQCKDLSTGSSSSSAKKPESK